VSRTRISLGEGFVRELHLSRMPLFKGTKVHLTVVLSELGDMPSDAFLLVDLSNYHVQVLPPEPPPYGPSSSAKPKMTRNLCVDAV
jgi:hypothetical protein